MQATICESSLPLDATTPKAIRWSYIQEHFFLPNLSRMRSPLSHLVEKLNIRHRWETLANCDGWQVNPSWRHGVIFDFRTSNRSSSTFCSKIKLGCHSLGLDSIHLVTLWGCVHCSGFADGCGGLTPPCLASSIISCDLHPRSQLTLLLWEMKISLKRSSCCVAQCYMVLVDLQLGLYGLCM